MSGRFSEDWGRGRELFTKTVKGLRRVVGWIKQFWLRRFPDRLSDRAVEQYYRTEYKNFREGVSRQQRQRDIIRMSSYY